MLAANQNARHNVPWLIRLKSPDEPSEPVPSEDVVNKLHDTSLPSDTLALALSGGGVRSAAFCLGVVQALARSGWLRRIDYLSTVSGGGYTGAFVGRLFDLCNTTHGESASYKAGTVQDRVAQELTNPHSRPTTWLRRHSNYLSPTGVGESLFNFAAFWRNFLSLQFVLAVFFFVIFGIMNALGYSDWWTNLSPVVKSPLSAVMPISSQLPASVSGPWAAIVELTVWLALLPLALAYWLVSQDRHESYVVSALLAAVIVAAALLIATFQPVTIAVLTAAVAWTIEAWTTIRRTEGHGDPHSRFRLVLARNHLTRRLAFWTAATTVIAALGLIDFFGQWLARSFLLGELTCSTVVGWFSALGASLLALAPLLRGLAMYLATREGDSQSLLSALGRIPYLPTLVLLAVGAFFPLFVLSFTSHAIFGLGYSWMQGIGATLVALLVSLLLGSREARAFVNRSGPLTIYSARLARVFLGAVNPERHRHADGHNVTHVIRGDDLPFDEYRPHRVGGPLHLMNVAVNETMDVASLRGMRDRQAENMAVGPIGVNIAQRWHARWRRSQTGSLALEPIVTDPGEPHPFLSHRGEPVDVERLNVRDWMGISGAALSPGMGRLTGAGRSLLYTISNLRLGYWWNSGLSPGERRRLPVQGKFFQRLKWFLFRGFRAQSLLIAELRGRFGGPWHRYWYLSDGGNFENTGVYELLRRRVPFIILCDAGQDRFHQGANLANLARIARVDFGAEIMEQCRCSLKNLQQLGVPEEVASRLGTSSDLLALPGNRPSKHATLLRFRFPQCSARCAQDPWHGREQSWVLHLKATVNGDEPADIRNYKALHPDFPNETTLDQFFDESQWESYRKLGDHIGSELFV
jgi:hypothetical protein